MDLQRRSLRVGAAVIACAILLRLCGDGVFSRAVQALSDPRTAAVLLYLESGYLLRPAEAETVPPVPELTELTEQTEAAAPAELVQAVFAPDDAALVEVNSVCGYDTDLPALLQQPLSWDLTSDAPTVLILHTHGTESYEKTEDYEESSDYRTLDEGYNVVSVGDALAQVLEAGGIKVIHDRTLHDYPSYSGSYNHARKSIKQILEENPTVSMVLDIHRDAVTKSDGSQMKFTVEKDGQTAAQLMMVVGTDAGGLKHPDWPENMSLAVKLHAQLEKNCPGICRPISFRKQRFNQDLSSGALIVEVGSTGNTRQEALLAAEILGQAIIDIAAGTA